MEPSFRALPKVAKGRVGPRGAAHLVRPGEFGRVIWTGLVVGAHRRVKLGEAKAPVLQY